MRLKYSPAARRDIERLYRESTQRFGMRHADAYYDGLVVRLDALKRSPETAPVRDDLRGRVRILHHKSHHIAYRIDPDEIIVLRVLHGRMDIARNLK